MDTHEQLLRAAKSGDLEGLATLLDAHPSWSIPATIMVGPCSVMPP